jgi:flagellar basal-body rod modification protein FlgD
MSTIESTTNVFDKLGLSVTKQSEEKNDYGQSDFMELMLAQMNNQNPLDPMENGEFLTQIAQFNTASGIEELNNSFSLLAGSLNSSQALQASTLVGRSVLVPGNSGMLETTGTLDGVIDMPSSTTSLRLNVYDGGGQLVRSVDMGQRSAGETAFSWDGNSDSGVRMPAGTYNLSAEAVIDGEVQAVNTLMGARVESVTLGQGGEEPTLNLSGMGSIAFSQVRQIM